MGAPCESMRPRRSDSSLQCVSAVVEGRVAQGLANKLGERFCEGNARAVTAQEANRAESLAQAILVRACQRSVKVGQKSASGKSL